MFCHIPVSMSEQLYPHSRFLLAAMEATQCPPDTGAEIAVTGRSNVGKSSVVNVISGRRALARVSRTPGRTRALLFFELKPNCRLVDLPGYGYAKAPTTETRRWPAMLERYFADRRALRGVLLVMDSRHPMQPLDERMLAFCRAYGLPVHVLLNKADKLSRNQARQTLSTVTAALPEATTAALLSCLTGAGREALRERLEAWFASAPGRPIAQI